MRIIPHRPDLQQEYHNPFKENNIYPFNKIGRCIVDKDTAEIKRWCDYNDSNFDINKNPINLDPNTEDVMVYIPAFYCKRHWNGTTLTDSILSKVPTTVTYSHGGEYKVHPAFLRSDNTIRPYILVGAFLGSKLNGQLRSIPNQTPTTGTLLANFRDSARQGRNKNHNIIDIHIINAIQLLYKISFQSINSQRVLGDGYVAQENISTTGTTLSLGNKSGSVNNNISLFGIEDMYGNIWSYVDGIAFRNQYIVISNDNNEYGNYDTYTQLYSTDNTFTGYGKNIVPNININIFQYATTEKETYYCDYYQPPSTSESCYIIGNRWYDKTKEIFGLFYYKFDVIISGATWRELGTRLCYLP